VVHGGRPIAKKATYQCPDTLPYERKEKGVAAAKGQRVGLWWSLIWAKEIGLLRLGSQEKEAEKKDVD
jgi:hypothetical protein